LPPTADQIKKASKHVAWEYVSMVAAAVEMAKGSWEGFSSPMNHLVQEAFLAHVRNLAEFFQEPRKKDNIYAVHFCASVGWQSKPFEPRTNLIQAINQTLSHMTYSRDRASRGHVHFEGYEHVHGTVNLLRHTWADFMKSVMPEFLHPQCPEDINYWLVEHTKDWRVKFSDLQDEFERRARGWSHWKLNETPDGPVWTVV
jgi:hypothetical protein